MRLTTKFSAFITLLTSLTIFVTLIGASLSFYNGIENKVENRVQAVATMLDNRLITTSFDKLEPQLDELMTPIEIVHIDFMLNGKPLYSHSRPDSYRPLGSHEQFREITVPSLKHPGITLHLVYVDPMVNYSMVLQFGLAEEYDRLQVTRLLPFLGFWPEENLALQLSVESLIRPRFQRWLRDALMQCEKSQRQRIIFELAEADVCQYIGRLQPVMRLVNALGVRVAVVQAGLTLVGTSWIKQLDAELIKLHPGLARNIEKRSENQLLVQSLVEACKGMPMQVFATGVRSRSEWLVLSQCGVTGGQGEFFAASQPLDTNVKKYSQRYSV